MSRRYGRFTGNGSEAFQRQMNAPVHKWKKAWVSPTGLQPESSYKICKWVRVDMSAEDGTPAPEDDEEMEDGEEGEQGEEGEGEAEDAGGEDGVTESKEDEVAAAATPAPNAVNAATEGVEAVPSAEAPKDAESNGMVVAAPEGPAGVSESTISQPSNELPTSVVDTTLPSTNKETIPPPSEPSPAVPTPEVAAEEPTIPITHPLPSNAIEISNTAPHTTELGSGDLAGVGGVEITQGETTGMEVDEPSGAAIGVDGGAEKGEALEMDDGLVMGDLEPAREEFVVQGEDKPREVDM